MNKRLVRVLATVQAVVKEGCDSPAEALDVLLLVAACTAFDYSNATEDTFAKAARLAFQAAKATAPPKEHDMDTFTSPSVGES